MASCIVSLDQLIRSVTSFLLEALIRCFDGADSVGSASDFVENSVSNRVARTIPQVVNSANCRGVLCPDCLKCLSVSFVS